jgi:C4-dicarboxylate-specific signal transduction histidine kinase
MSRCSVALRLRRPDLGPCLMGAREIVDAHGGSLTVLPAEPGAGATFVVHLARVGP